MVAKMVMSHKEDRFVIVPADFYDPAVMGVINMVVLSDYKFWADHYAELQEWCGRNGGQLNGMCVGFESVYQLDLFVLRWS